MRRAGSADLPLHGGRVPAWLGQRMSRLGAVVAQAIVHHYGRDEFLRRLAHPFWFQSFGAVMGMDWHSSGITTSVIGALKRGLAPLERELGIHVCGGRGGHSRRTPQELAAVGERTGIDGDALADASRLVAKVDSAAVQDGFDLYLHGFIVTDEGRWAVVQQGMNGGSRRARRYHWLSEDLKDFVDAPHAAIDGPGQGRIVNLTDRRARASRRGQLELLREFGPERIARQAAELALLPGAGAGRAAAANPAAQDRAAPGPAAKDTEPAGAAGCAQERPAPAGPPAGAGAQLALPHLDLPAHHDVRPEDVNLRRLHAALAAAAERGPQDFADLLRVPGVGARTVRALALVAEVVHGAPCRFQDPARFSMAHGGKDRHPFPVPCDVYDRTIGVLKSALSTARLGNDERLQALRRLDDQARRLERVARGPALPAFIEGERRDSAGYGGRSVYGPERPAAAVR